MPFTSVMQKTCSNQRNTHHWLRAEALCRFEPENPCFTSREHAPPEPSNLRIKEQTALDVGW
jgi:hypothetical protein